MIRVDVRVMVSKLLQSHLGQGKFRVTFKVMVK